MRAWTAVKRAGQRGWAAARERRRALLLAAGAILAGVFLLRLILPPAVEVVDPERRPVVETLVTTGRVRNVSRASVGAPVGGTVSGVLVREGARVRRGQLLVQLEDAEAVAAAAGARARLAEAEASLGRVATVAEPSSAAELEAAELEARQRARDVERNRRLFEAGAVARTDLEQAERLAETAQARLAAARTTARSAAAGGADRRVAEAAVDAARGAVVAADARVELTRVRAPAAGTVLERDVEPGDIVSAGSVLMTISLDGPTELVVFPDERVLGSLRPGLEAVASADAFPDRRFPAQVDQVAPVIDPTQGTVEVRLSVPAPPAYLVPDMTVSVNIELARRAAALALPLAAVREPLTDAPWVLAVRDGRTVRVPVTLGVRDAQYAEVLAGVEPDALVVLDPTAVEPGERVRARRR